MVSKGSKRQTPPWRDGPPRFEVPLARGRG